MGNPQNRARKRARIPPSKKANKFKDGEPRDKEAVPEPEPSGAKIGVEREHFGISSENIETVREGIIFIDLSILFDVFDELLKCPDCGEDMTSHVDMEKTHGYSHCIV